MDKNVEAFMEDVATKNPGEKEFHQAVQEVAESIMPYIQKNPKYTKAKILERITEPERVIMFRVPWIDDSGEYQINNNKAELFHPYIAANGDCSVLTEEEAKLVLAERILMAKELGFSTILVPDYPSAFDKGRESYDITLIEPELKRVALELAEIAQEYKADYLAPVNEYEHLLYSNGYSMEEISPLFSAFYDDLIPRIREIYDGKIIIKCGNVGNWDDFSMLSMTGADLFGVGNAYMSNKGEVSEDIADMAYAADDVSERDDVPWFISEFLVFNSDDQIDMFGEVRSTITTDEAYEEALDAFSLKGSGASGFSFMSWTGTGKIRNTEAAEHVENLFDEK